MIRKLSLVFILVAAAAPIGNAAPILNVVPGGLQGGNWVWDVSVTPDLLIASDTPMAVELGFRLTASSLISAVDINPSQWDTPNPGNFIFGWETPDPSANNKPVGLQTNLTTSEIFAAYGSIDFTTPGAKPFLQIVAKGPSNGGSTSSTIQWLGAYAVGQGRIAQTVGSFAATNFDIYSGTATQQVPEPASIVLVGLGAMFAGFGVLARRRGA
ncbi:MAG TPA: PEP-CTERM sorting domain-containing protein [Lacipirellulaceae bacterium]|jgi:hypothetical protein|nr:PEP-CTERM sorting domain-containing protein [Lacipirellulaceae bacterium]